MVLQLYTSLHDSRIKKIDLPILPIFKPKGQTNLYFFRPNVQVHYIKWKAYLVVFQSFYLYHTLASYLSIPLIFCNSRNNLYGCSGRWILPIWLFSSCNYGYDRYCYKLLYCIVLFVLYCKCIVLYCIVLYCIVLPCIILKLAHQSQLARIINQARRQVTAL